METAHQRTRNEQIKQMILLISVSESIFEQIILSSLADTNLKQNRLFVVCINAQLFIDCKVFLKQL